MENLQENCCHRLKHRAEGEKQALLNRLSRLEGQIRGIRSMVEGDRYCVDILTQTAAVSAAVAAFNRELLSEHLKTCVAHDLQAGNTETVDELLHVLEEKVIELEPIAEIEVLLRELEKKRGVVSVSD